MVILIKKLKSLKHSLYRYQLNFFRIDNLNRDFIYKVILDMEKWRREYNKNCFGRGIDPYCRYKILDYPMAYAFYVRGFLEVYHHTGNRLWLENAIQAADKLIELKFEKSKVWGLPFLWQDRQNEPYLITTAIVGHSFIELYKTTSEKKYLREVEDIIEWIINDLGYCKRSKGLCFWYSPNLKKHVINSSAQATALIVRYIYITQKQDEIEELIQESLKYIQNKQLSNYMWDYYGENEEPKNIIDFHNNYIIESNYYLRKYFNLQYKQEEQLIILPFISLCNNLLNKNGSLKERLYQPIEARLWAYGAFLSTGTMVFDSAAHNQYSLKIRKNILLLLSYVFSHLYLFNIGVYKYRSNDLETKFIRHIAHMFYGLSKLLNLKDFWEKYG